MYNRGGLGFEPVTVASSIVGTMADAFGRAYTALESFFGIGEGRREADVIVPLQNDIHARLRDINNQILSASIPLLQQLHQETAAIGIMFLDFLRSDRFEDGRASVQAADTIMPLIDGTSGYTWPELAPTARDGRGGTLGTIERRIQALGGTVQPPLLTQGPGVPGLSYPLPSWPYLPQAGTLPPTSMLPSVSAPPIGTVGGGNMLPILAGGLLLLAVARRRR